MNIDFLPHYLWKKKICIIFWEELFLHEHTRCSGDDLLMAASLNSEPNASYS
jgi:hypothetical protein